MAFSGQEAWKIAAALAFPRAVGSPGEEAAASLIERNLLSRGYSPKREEFLVPLSSSTALKGLTLGAAAVLIGTRSLAASSPFSAGLVLFFLAALLFLSGKLWLILAGSESIVGRLSKWRGGKNIRTLNIVAHRPASGRAERHIYLIAHFDSKSQSPPLLLRSFLLLLSGIASLWLGIGYLRFPPETLNSFPSLSLDFPLAISVLALLPFVGMRTANSSPGALDNAGSLGVLLHLADCLREDKLRCKITFLFTGAEELGLQGAFAYCQRHRLTMGEERACFINLDGVGVKGKTRIIGSPGLLAPGKRPDWILQLEELARPFGIGVRSFSFGVLMDHQAFAEKGYPAVSLAGVSREILRIHTAKDTADQLEPEGLEEVGNLLLAWIREEERSGNGGRK